MWSLAILIYAICKGLTWCRRKPIQAAAWKHLAYLIAWPGMDVDAFLGSARADVPRPTLAAWGFALVKLALGAAVLVWVVPRLTSIDEYLVGWVGMLGLVLTLHFGLFDLLSCIWRRLGLLAAPIMNWPIASRSLTEFWGSRWNLAFRDLTHRFLFRPLWRRLGAAGSLLAGFLLSGLVHDFVISVPAGGGFGLPTCYFAIQGVGILLERSRRGRALGLGRGSCGWVFCLLVVVGPCTLLFHKPFVCRIIVPFLHSIGVAP